VGDWQYWWYVCKACGHRQKELLKESGFDSADMNRSTESGWVCKECGATAFTKDGRALESG
jgi:hypothetical protein